MQFVLNHVVFLSFIRTRLFYLQWPFIRLFGIQEPASTFCSLLNGLAHVAGLIRFRKAVPSSAPMYWIYHFNALVSKQCLCFPCARHVPVSSNCMRMCIVEKSALKFESQFIFFFTYHMYCNIVKSCAGVVLFIRISNSPISKVFWK